MDQEIKLPEERRKKYIFNSIADILIGRQSRKVAFGVWGFWISNAFLASGKITEKTWWWSFLTCASLIGFGTILDSILEKMGDRMAEIVVQKIKADPEKT